MSKKLPDVFGTQIQRADEMTMALQNRVSVRTARQRRPEPSYKLNQTELDKQAKALREDPNGQVLLENYREAIRSSAEQGMMQRQVSMARFAANRVLTGGPSGVSNQERATADTTLARISNLRLSDTSTTVINTTKLTEPGVAGNRILATQAVVARALTMDPQVTQLRQRTAVLSQEENRKLGRDEAYVSAVVAIDEKAGLAAETGNRELAARTTERAMASPALELSGRSLPTPG